jgi:uncharacterized protein
MSEAPRMRREDRVMAEAAVLQLLAHGYSGRLATVGADGWPYVVPLLYVWKGGQIWVHNTGARGHLRGNVDHDSRVCFEVDEPGEVFPYGRFECDSALAYRSVVAFGRISVVDERAAKTAFFEALMDKYGDPGWSRPKGFFPRLDEVTVYAIAIERMTGKETALPPAQDRWPALDRTKSPHARP